MLTLSLLPLLALVLLLLLHMLIVQDDVLGQLSYGFLELIVSLDQVQFAPIFTLGLQHHLDKGEIARNELLIYHQVLLVLEGE